MVTELGRQTSLGLRHQLEPSSRRPGPVGQGCICAQHQQPVALAQAAAAFPHHTW